MAGVNRIISGRLAQTKSKGKKFLDELWAQMKPASIAKEKGTGKMK